MSVGMAAPRALYACDPDRSRGRLFAEPPSKTRSPFRRDCDRVIHSTAFRRLKHKTQVFVFHEGDHYRTRLTHSLEVAQIARALARQLGLDEDLTETLALAHDLGHPPFGHAGERALDKCLQAHGGFDHNAQTLRVVTSLEHRYPDFDGLNLTWESLEGIVKHNGPLTERSGAPVGGKGGIPVGIADFNRKLDLELWSFASLEAQVAAFADDIAYDAHDIDDGLRAGLFAVDDLKVMPLTAAIIADIGSALPRSRRRQARRRTGARADLLPDRGRGRGDAEASGGRQAAIGPRRPPLPPADGRVSAAVRRQEEAAIKAFLWQRMYRHARVMRVMGEAEGILFDLFARYQASPGDLPAEWVEGTERKARASGRAGSAISSPG